MSDRPRNAIIVAAALLAAWFMTPWARTGWFLIAVPRSYSTSFAWLDYAFVSLWVFQLLWAVLFGAILAWLLKSKSALWWSLLLGLVLGLSQLVGSTYHFAANASPSTYVWAYGQYVVPAIGALVASWAVVKHWSTKGRGANAA